MSVELAFKERLRTTGTTYKNDPEGSSSGTGLDCDN
jgi:hypothetical protein